MADSEEVDWESQRILSQASDVYFKSVRENRELPLLPPELYKPLECTATACRQPGAPLPGNLADAVSFAFWSKFDESLARAVPAISEVFLQHCSPGLARYVRNWSEGDSETTRVQSNHHDKLVDACKNLLRSRRELGEVDVSAEANASEGPGSITNILREIDSASPDSPDARVRFENRGEIDNLIKMHIQTGFDSSFAVILAEIDSTSPNWSKGITPCLHDVAGVIARWSDSKLSTKGVDSAPDSAAFGRLDVEMIDVAEELKMPMMGMTLRKYTEMQSAYAANAAPSQLSPPLPYLEKSVKRYVTSNRFLAGYRLMLNEVTSPLAIISHLLLTSVAASPPSRNILHDLRQYGDSPFKKLSLRVAVLTAASLWTVRDSRSLSYRTLTLAKSDWSGGGPQTQNLNDSALFYSVVHSAHQPCPPDRCSGRTPLVDNRDRVEQLLGKLVDLHFVRAGLAATEYERRHHRSRVVTLLLEDTALECRTEAQQSALRAQLESAFHATIYAKYAWRQDPNKIYQEDWYTAHEVFREVGTILQTIQAASSATSATRSSLPCRCDLTYLRSELEHAVERISDHVAGLFQDISPLAPFSLKATLDCIELGPGASQAERKQHRVRLTKFLEWIRDPLDEVMLRREHLVAHVMVSRHLASVVPSRLLQEIIIASERTCDPKDSSEMSFEGVGDRVLELMGVKADDEFAKVAKFLVYTVSSKHDLLLPDFYSAMGAIALPSYWPFHLNAAALQLRLVDDSHDHLRFDDSNTRFRYSRAIYDCTAALHYGGPNFKAYYRRGLALSRLKMYPKAAEDFKRALEIQPENPLILRELAAVSRASSKR